MIRPRRRLRISSAVLFSTAVLLLTTACGGGGGTASGGGGSENEGDPVAGGSARVLQSGEPRTLDPAGVTNNWANQPMLGNALYGTLMVNDGDSTDLEYKMATDFSTTDGGTTFNLALRPNLTFTDGTPLDAAAVKFNWDRLKDPALASQSLRQAVQVANTEVVDATNLKVTMATQNPHFGNSLVAGSMNWIASPTALAAGPEAFDRAPIGAGPFTLTSWTRQAAIELQKNPDYYDAPKPYLDTLTINTVSDSNTRISTMTTGGSDIAAETNIANINKAEAAGLQAQTVSTGGGQIIAMNERRAPFDDVRARKAVSLAADVEALNTIVYNGENVVPTTLFDEDSKYYADVKLQETNKDEAQRLFDELASEGKPVKFSFLSYPTTESRTLAEALQSQLSTFENVDMQVEVLDYGAAIARSGQRDFDMVISSAVVEDPDLALWGAFSSKSQGNITGISDPQLDEALDAGRIGESDDVRIPAYTTVQERIAELVPGIWYSRAVPSVIYADNVHGMQMFTLGAVLPEELWMN